MGNTFAFIQAIKGQAVTDMRNHKILASLTIAQSILESGWGESYLSKKCNNLFGIKSNSWNDNRINLPTTEYVNGVKTNVNAYFRSYKSWSESIADHTRLLLTSRYARIIGVTDYKKVCKLIKDCGYATDISYTNKLISIIETYKLYQYDKETNVEIIINRAVDGMNIKTLQTWLNTNGFVDKNGKKLVVDGIQGESTLYAKLAFKNALSYVLK